MQITITDTLTARTANDGQAVSFAVRVLDASSPPALVVPATLRYRVDNLRTGYNVTAWTDVTPASTATIVVTGAQNTLTECRDSRYQITVEADHGLSTNAVATREYHVRNLIGVYA